LQPALEATQATGAPFSYVFLSILCSLAACCQDKIEVERMQGLKGPVSLIGGGIGRSGERKSAVVEMICAPLFEHADASDGGFVVVGDASRSELLQLLTEGSVSVMTDEGGPLFSPEAEDLLPLLIQGWNGGRIRFYRKGKRVVLSTAVSCFYMIPPDTMLAALRMKGGHLRSSGVLARQLLCWPQSLQGYRWVNEPRQPEHVPRLHALFEDILGQSVPGAKAIIRLTKEAFEFWRAYCNEIEAELQQSGGTLQDVSDFVAKSGDIAARIAALYHFAQGREGAAQADTMLQAIRVAAWFLQQAKFLFGEAGIISDARKDAEQLAKFLTRRFLREGKHMVEKNTIRNNCHMRDVVRLNESLAILEAGGRVTVSEWEGRTYVYLPAFATQV
jgi:hypothetical protein